MNEQIWKEVKVNRPLGNYVIAWKTFFSRKFLIIFISFHIEKELKFVKKVDKKEENVSWLGITRAEWKGHSFAFAFDGEEFRFEEFLRIWNGFKSGS